MPPSVLSRLITPVTHFYFRTLIGLIPARDFWTICWFFIFPNKRFKTFFFSISAFSDFVPSRSSALKPRPGSIICRGGYWYKLFWEDIRYYGRMVWRVCLCDPTKSITCIGMLRWILEESIFQCLYFQPLRSWFNLTNQRKGGTYVSENICTPSPLWTCWVFSKTCGTYPTSPVK